jgi:hypothetical protein
MDPSSMCIVDWMKKRHVIVVVYRMRFYFENLVFDGLAPSCGIILDFRYKMESND